MQGIKLNLYSWGLQPFLIMIIDQITTTTSIGVGAVVGCCYYYCYY